MSKPKPDDVDAAGAGDDFGDTVLERRQDLDGGTDGQVLAAIADGTEDDDLDAGSIVEVELSLDELDEVPIIDEVVMEPRERRFRWTPGLGVSTKSVIRVGVMLGRPKGSKS